MGIGMKARKNSDWNSRPIRSMSRDAREHCLGGVYAGTAVPTGVMKSFETCWAKKDKRLYGDRAKSVTERFGDRAKSVTDMSDAGMKPSVSHAQLVREAFICKTAQEMMRDFQSIVIDVHVSRGARVMWTSVPDDLKHIFNCTDIKTVDTWKQTMHGDCQLDISMFKRGDRVKMSVQSIGVSGKHMHQPLIRGVPD